mmetsp:Transcript_39849/g.109677  ORF Transcript_39849/g.109677 Transcript_39849/m.109677 type:complete len:387 (-) Transcript_39849:206-1366(-)
MEVTILEACDAPDRPVLSLTMGRAHHQQPLEVGRSFLLPQPAAQDARVRVDLLQQIGGEFLRLDGAPASVCSIPIQGPDGLGTAVKLRVRCSPDVGDLLSAPDTRSPPATSSSAGSLDDERQQRDRFIVPVQWVMRSLLDARPAEPYRFMLEQLRAMRSASQVISPMEGSHGSPGVAQQAPRSSGHMPRPPDRACSSKKGRRKLISPTATSESPAAKLAGDCGCSSPPTSSPSPQGESQAPRAPDRPCSGPKGRRVRHLAPAAPKGSMSTSPKAQSSSQTEARFSVQLVLRGSACLAVAEEEIREEVRAEASRKLAQGIMSAARRRVSGEAVPLRMSRPGSATGRPRSAAQKLDRQTSLPTPYVSISAEPGNWSRWASDLNKKCAR